MRFEAGKAREQSICRRTPFPAEAYVLQQPLTPRALLDDPQFLISFSEMYRHCAYSESRACWVPWAGRPAGTGCEVALPRAARGTRLLPRPRPALLPTPGAMSVEARSEGLQRVTGTGLMLTARRCAGALSAYSRGRVSHGMTASSLVASAPIPSAPSRAAQPSHTPSPPSARQDHNRCTNTSAKLRSLQAPERTL